MKSNNRSYLIIIFYSEDSLIQNKSKSEIDEKKERDTIDLTSSQELEQVEKEKEDLDQKILEIKEKIFRREKIQECILPIISENKLNPIEVIDCISKNFNLDLKCSKQEKK